MGQGKNSLPENIILFDDVTRETFLLRTSCPPCAPHTTPSFFRLQNLQRRAVPYSYYIDISKRKCIVCDIVTGITLL